MRQYWIPAALSSELQADGDPMRLMLLGEKLVAFRDSQGCVGIFDHRCPHRCASLYLGRNEESGIRCVYHGWKFDVDGNCVDLATSRDHLELYPAPHPLAAAHPVVAAAADPPAWQATICGYIGNTGRGRHPGRRTVARGSD